MAFAVFEDPIADRFRVLFRFTARKARLGGGAQISTDKFPRVVYAAAVSLKRVLDLSDLGASPTG